MMQQCECDMKANDDRLDTNLGKIKDKVEQLTKECEEKIAQIQGPQGRKGFNKCIILHLAHIAVTNTDILSPRPPCPSLWSGHNRQG